MAGAQPTMAATEQPSGATGLLEGTYEDIEEAFSLFDIDGDGLISLQELLSVIESVGKQCSVDDAKEILLMVDKDEDGMINFDEFYEVLKEKILKGVHEEDLQEAFQVFDSNGSGFINAREIRDIFRTLGEAITEEEAEEMLAVVDKNEDGLMDFQELKSYYMSEQYRQQQQQEE